MRSGSVRSAARRENVPKDGVIFRRISSALSSFSQGQSNKRTVNLAYDGSTVRAASSVVPSRGMVVRLVKR